MSCHGCAYEAALPCAKQNQHLPSNQVACQNCLRNPVAKATVSDVKTDNYISTADLLDTVGSYRIEGNHVYIGVRCVGHIFTFGNGQRGLRTTRNRKDHYMRIFKGWGMSKAVLQFLKEQGITAVQIKIGKNDFLNSLVWQWFTHGTERKFPGFENQIFLPEKYMAPRKTRVWNLPEISP